MPQVKKFFTNLHLDDLVRMLKFLKGNMVPYVICISLSAIFFTVYQIFIAFINREMINAIVTGNPNRMYTAVILTGIVLIITCIIQPTLNYYYERIKRQGVLEIRADIYRVVQKLPFSYFEKSHSGDIISRSSNDINSFSNAYGWQLDWTVTVSIWGIGSMIVTFALDWRLSVVMILLGCISMFFNISYSGPMREISNTIQQSMGRLTQYLSDILAGFRILKVFDVSRIVVGRYFDENSIVAEASIQRAIKNSKMGSVSYLIDAFSIVGVIIFGSFLIANKSVDLGTVMAIISLQTGVAAMFSHLGGAISFLQGSLAGVGRVSELITQKTEPYRYGVSSGEFNEGIAIGLENVCFGYNDDRSALREVNMSIDNGKVAAIVGPSGSGKSTIVKLLMGYYPPDAGGISINGKAMGEYTLEELRQLMSYVPQESYLFDTTIEENIKYGKVDASHEEVLEAAKKANAHEFIMKLPDGYSTRVGERGLKLSGGQKQRIAIARALLKDAPIILLDEATSSLDSDSEQLVQDALKVLMVGRTVVVIAHRLSTIENSDVIYVIDDGLVLETGTHSELLLKGGLYSNLYNKQYSKSF